MKNFRLLFCTLLLSCGWAAAQTPKHPQYIQTGSETVTFVDAYKKWQPTQPLYKDDAAAAENEQFYISRVKPKTRFTNSQTQVNPEQSTERKALWWVPISKGGWNAIPNYFFDSEVFNMWSYIDHYGNWTANMIQMAGAFTDVCHKNGVSTSTLDGVPFGDTVTPTKGSGLLMRTLIDDGAEKYLKYLKYYGIDGIGYNSEFNINKNFAREFSDFLADGFNKKAEFNMPDLSLAWYSLTNNAGSISGASWDCLNTGNDMWFQNSKGTTSNYFFTNYNWGASEIATSIATAKIHSRSTYDVYMGMNMQGESSVPWDLLAANPVSIGFWGAHDMNMLFESRGEQGSEPAVSQDTYLKRSELFFTGGSKNPVNTPAISNILYYSLGSATKFHGVSKFVTARSALNWELDAEPFVTYLNLGNGGFFNSQGKTSFNKEWYNIGIQDYLPTWRWWWSSTFMGRNSSDVPVTGLSAQFTWDDAWFGGSCVKITGSAAEEYLQLFKTKFEIAASDKFTIRYKVLKGTGKLAFSNSVEGAESEAIMSKEVELVVDEKGEWKTYEVSAGRTFPLSGKTLAMLGLKFTDTQDLDVLIGEISVKRGEYPTPVAPVITNFKALALNYQGVDAKVVFKMKDETSATPVYNSDVNTWFYKIYTQQEGETEVLCTATTSWAAYVVGAPIKPTGNGKLRMGVQAVSLDGDTQSAISWSDYVELPVLAVTEGLEVDKPVIKANEEFTVRYTDPNHVEAKEWKIVKSIDQSEIFKSEGGKYMSHTLQQEGAYDVFVEHANGLRDTLRAMVQISAPEVGAMPRIESLKANNSDVAINANTGDNVTYAYIGRPSDGTVSRGLNLPEKGFGFETNQDGLDESGSAMGARTKFTLTFWVKLNKLLGGMEGTTFLNIRYPKDGWPMSDWGYYWQDILDNGLVQGSIKGSDWVQLYGYNMIPKQWYHFAYVFDYSDKGRSIEYFVNGCRVGKHYSLSPYTWKSGNYLMIGGKAANRAGLDGVLDEVQYYTRALTEAEIPATMQHQDVLPAGLAGYWDFETESSEDKYLSSTGTLTTLKASVLQQSTIAEGNNVFENQTPDFAPGTPFIAGKNYQITTLPQWKTQDAKVTTAGTGDTNAGNIVVNYPAEGKYSATLTLQNGWGKDVKTFEYVTVTKGVGIEENETIEISAYPNPFVSEVIIRFAQTGNYSIKVFDATGKTISENQMSPSDNDFVSITINGTSGIYFVQVSENGRILKTLKVIKK